MVLRGLATVGVALAILGVLFLLVGTPVAVFGGKYTRVRAETAPFSGDLSGTTHSALFGPQTGGLAVAKILQGSWSPQDGLDAIFTAEKPAFYKQIISSSQQGGGMVEATGTAFGQFRGVFVTISLQGSLPDGFCAPLDQFGAGARTGNGYYPLHRGTHLPFSAFCCAETCLIVQSAGRAWTPIGFGLAQSITAFLRPL